MTKRERKKSKQNEIISTEFNEDTKQRYESGEIKKKWSPHDLNHIKPITNNQSIAFDSWFSQSDRPHLALLGVAGSGKSFLSIYMAMRMILPMNSPYKKLKIVRSIVQTRQIGALPGTLEEKKQPIFSVYEEIFYQLFSKPKTLKNMADADMIEFVDTSYIRGSTWNDCIVFIDEINNLNDHEIHTVMTRIGNNTRILIAGDEKQSDLIGHSKNDKFNYGKFLSTINKIDSIGKVFFTVDDIVRSKFVKEWIIANE